MMPSLKEGAATTGTSVLRTLLLTDLVRSTELVERLGDRRTAEIFAVHDRMARDLLATHGGREIDKTDGFLFLFDHPADALAFALAYHRALAELSTEEGIPLYARAGIHLGEVVLRENSAEDVARGAKPQEVEGLAKPTAARVMGLAGAKQTLLTRGAFDLVREAGLADPETAGRLRWLAHGPYLFQGVPEPLEIFEVGDPARAPLEPPAESLKARRAVAAGDEITLGWRPAPGQEIPRRPRWLLDNRLGEGGFGEVWKAVHRRTGERRVFKFCYDGERLRALRREVALFRLLKEALGDREDITRILDWSFEEAPYFLESEYTEGGSLAQWAEERGGLREVPVETRLELIAEVAEALAAAHSVGVLHKDVKPENVLITTDRAGRPRARLTDFGIGLVEDARLLLEKGITVAGFTDVGDLTSSGGGSRIYTAPEILEGKPATVQADIYALGVMLYQMTLGDLAHALAPGWERDIEDELLAEDIAAFVDGSPERRPASALEVAEKLRNLEERRERRVAEKREREEAERAIRALEKAQRRRKIGTAIAAASVLVLVVVSIFAFQALRARGEADRRRGQAEDLIGFMLGDLRDKLAPVGRLEILDDVGDKALEYFEAIPEEELTDDETVRRSQALSQIGEVRMAQGDLDAAMEAFQESLTLIRGLGDRAPRLSDQELLRRAQALSRIGQVRVNQGDLGAAMEAFDEALTLDRELGARDPRRPEWQAELGAGHFWVGFVHWRQGDLEAALDQFHAYQKVSERLVELEPEKPKWELEVAYAHSNLGSVLEARGDLEGALPALETSLNLRRELLKREPPNAKLKRGLATAHNKVGKLQEANGQLQAALVHYRAELDLRTSLAELDPTHTAWQLLLGISHNYVGNLNEVLGKLQVARRHFGANLEISRRLTQIDPENTVWSRHLAITEGRVGVALLAEGSVSEALEFLSAELKILEELVEKEPREIGWRIELGRAKKNYSRALLAAGDAEVARSAAASAVALLAAVLEEDPGNRTVRRRAAETHLQLGRARKELGDDSGARVAWKQALELIEPLARGSRDKRALDPWATSLLYLGRAEEARPVIETLEEIGYRQPFFQKLCELYGVDLGGNKSGG